MSSEHTRNRGSLFQNADKKKPSQPDMRGDCTLAGAAYDIQAWRREDQLSISLAPARGDKNSYRPDAFRGALDPAPKARGGDEPAPAWIGDIEGEDGSYTVRAFQKQGKSGPYLTLSFEPAAPPEA